MKPPKHVVVRIELTPDAKQQIVDYADRSGMTQIAVMSRLVEWFAAQPEAVQSSIVAGYPPEVDARKLILQRLASG